MENGKVKVYFAAPIFAEANIFYNELIVGMINEMLGDKIDMYVPQKNASINDKRNCASAEDIAVGDFDNNLNKADIVVALVDGDVPPIGTTIEIGYFSRMCQEEIERNGSTKKKIISLYTDSRECSATYSDAKVNMLHSFAECQFSYINLLLVGALKRYGTLCSNINMLLNALKDAVEAYYE